MACCCDTFKARTHNTWCFSETHGKRAQLARCPLRASKAAAPEANCAQIVWPLARSPLGLRPEPRRIGWFVKKNHCLKRMIGRFGFRRFSMYQLHQRRCPLRMGDQQKISRSSDAYSSGDLSKPSGTRSKSKPVYR